MESELRLNEHKDQLLIVLWVLLVIGITINAKFN